MLPMPGNVEKHTRAETPMNAHIYSRAGIPPASLTGRVNTCEAHDGKRVPLTAQQQHNAAARLRAEAIRRQNRIDEAVREELIEHWIQLRGSQRFAGLIMSLECGGGLGHLFARDVRARFAAQRGKYTRLTGTQCS